MVDLIECICKIHDKDVSLFPLSHVIHKLICKFKELRLTRPFSSESVLLMA